MLKPLVPLGLELGLLLGLVLELMLGLVQTTLLVEKAKLEPETAACAMT